MNCKYCGNTKLYILKTHQLKCSKCKKKFSLNKIQQKKNIIECFCNNLTINQATLKLSLNYITIKKQYTKLRQDIALYLENSYIQEDIIAYEEYLYIEKSKKIKNNIFDAKNIISFEYNNKIFNLLMPSLNTYKEQFLTQETKITDNKEFSKFLKFNKISNIKKEQTLIHNFWYFFEDEILKYKGVNNDSFFYYLKEIEFKFNYSKNKQIDILNKIYFLDINLTNN
jgi:transposase-like protein